MSRTVRTTSAGTRHPRFRRSPHLVSYWRDGSLVFHNYALNRRTIATPRVCTLLDHLEDWLSADEVARATGAVAGPAFLRGLEALAAHGLIQRSDRPDPRDDQLSGWGGWNPVAGFFHFATREGRYPSDPLAIDRRLRRKARTTAMPSPVKHYPTARAVALPEPSKTGELAATLLGRRTWRRFARRSLAKADLATLLNLTWGAQRWATVAGQGRVALKTSPSGGARHSIEVYVVARRVAGLEKGLYHYDCAAHRLERLASRKAPPRVVEYLPGQSWYAEASALFVMTAVFAREQWRYETPRAYRSILIEAGHLCQTFCLLATRLGLAPFCSAALADARIERDLGLNAISESVVYLAGVGARPDGIVTPSGSADRLAD